MFSSLKIPAFRMFWSAMLVSLVGSWIQITAQGWLVFTMTHSAFMMGIVGFLGSLPMLLFSLSAGVLADRVSKRDLLVLTQSLLALLALLLGYLVKSGMVQVWQVALIAVLSGTVFSFDSPTRQAMVAELVGKEQLLNAIALNSAIFNAARIVGPAVASALIVVTGMSGCFFANGLSYLPVVAVLLMLKPGVVSNGQERKRFKDDIGEAFAFIRSSRFLSALLTIVGLVSFFGVSYLFLMPVFAQDILGSGVKGLAFLMSSNGIGAMLGALNLARIKEAQGRWVILHRSVVIFFISVMIFSLSTNLLFSCLCLVAVGWGSASAMSVANTMVQAFVPDHFRGRMMGVFMLLFSGLVPFGNLLSGALAHAFGAPVVVCVGAILSLGLYVILRARYALAMTESVHIG
jgi:MFS family permease